MSTAPAASAVTNDQAGFYPLNRTEFGYVALDGMIGTVNQPYQMRFSAPVSAAQMRAALRVLVSHHPRLRAIAEPGLHFYRFNVRPDDEIIDQLFEQAFIVELGISADDAPALLAYHNRFINEPCQLEHGLGLKARFIEHPERPVMFFSVPHLFGDGRSMMLWISDLMRLLNGLPIERQPMEHPPMWRAIIPQKLSEWPAKVAAARRHRAEEKRRAAGMHIVQMPTRETANYSTHAIHQHVSPLGTDALRPLAKRLGASVNTMVVAALADAFLQMRPNDPQAAAALRLSVDLRPHFPEGTAPLAGNQVGAFMIYEQHAAATPQQRLDSVNAQIKEGLARYKRREMCWYYLMEELLPLVGRTVAANIVLSMKRKNRFPRISCHTSSLGNGGFLNPEGARIRLAEFYPVATSASPLAVTVELDGKLYTTIAWQACETTPAEVRELCAYFDASLLRLAADARAEGQADAVPSAMSRVA